MEEIMDDTELYPLSATPSASAYPRRQQSRVFATSRNPSDRNGRLLFKRDACFDAFGTGWTDSSCAPGNTLCCVNSAQSYPQCQQYLGLGWCCTEYQKECYADLSSACGQPGAVSCLELAAGVSQACCPQYTTCASGYNASLTFVRCNIAQTYLQALAASTTSLVGGSTQQQTQSPSTSSQPSTTSSPSSQSTTSLSSGSSAVISSDSTTGSASSGQASSLIATPTSAGGSQASITTPPTSSQQPAASLSAGAIAGIAIGPALFVLVLALCAWFFWYKRKRPWQSGAAAYAAKPAVLDQPHHDPGSWPGYIAHPQELPDTETRELPSDQVSPKELRTHNTFRRSQIAELDSSANK